jgi:glutamate-5-semialdehyde dehydrogenase
MTQTLPSAAAAVPDPSPDLLARAAAVRRAAMALGQCGDEERRGAVRARPVGLRAPPDTKRYQ